VRRLYDLKHWSERTVIALVMQTADNSITTFGKRDRLGRWRLTSKQGHGAPNPSWIPVGNEVARRMARIMKGTPGGTIGEPFNVPMTAHFIGGCVIGDSAETGVVDPYHRVYGYEGMHILDGSTISANLGVNPSLTITAQAERAVSFWPNKNDQDPRPVLGSAYRRVQPVAPVKPVVPVDAPGALRLPIVEIKRPTVMRP
jgi:cholesterol oxidase